MILYTFLKYEDDRDFWGTNVFWFVLNVCIHESIITLSDINFGFFVLIFLLFVSCE